MKQDNLIFGRHAVKSALQEQPDQIESLIIQRGSEARLRALIQQATNHQITVRYESRPTLDEMAENQRHQGVIAICQGQHGRLTKDESALFAHITHHDNMLLLALDGVTDPHNLGACLRTAEAAGVLGVIIPKDKSVGITPVVRKVACGAAERLPVFAVTNLVRTLKKLQNDAGYWVVGLAGEAEKSIYETDLTGRIVLVMGSEGKGLRRLTRETCDSLAKIPMVGQVESLNVSVATGIALFESLRQRQARR